jgi:hypothetical protein
MFHLEVSDLKFCEHIDYNDNNCCGYPWVEITNSYVKKGAVGYMGEDRDDDSNLFVVVEDIVEDSLIDNWNKRTVQVNIKVIFPRIRMIDGEIVLGQDKAGDTEDAMNFECAKSCQTNNIYQGSCFFCTCGAFERVREEYGKTFVPCNENKGEYKIYEITAVNKPRFCLLGCQGRDIMINRLDSSMVRQDFIKAVNPVRIISNKKYNEKLLKEKLIEPYYEKLLKETTDPPQGKRGERHTSYDHITYEVVAKLLSPGLLAQVEAELFEKLK